MPRRCRAAPARLGVIWPNNRDVDDLVPYLDRLAVVALVFPTFRDGRAYSQARLLRERHGFKGELRATGQVLRDQFVFMLRAGFDAFEVKKEADAEAFAATVKRYSVFYQPTGDGRITALHRRMQLRHSESAGSMNALAHQVLPERTARELPPAAELDRALRDASPAGGDRDGLAGRRPRASRRGLVVRHRIGGAAQGDGRCRSRDTRGVSRYRLAVRGDAGLSRHADRDARPARRPFDQAAWKRRCRARIRNANCGSPIPMPAAGSAKSSRWRGRWRRSMHGSTAASVFRAASRADIPVVEQDGIRLKFNPFANVSREDDRGDLRAVQNCRRIRSPRQAICRSAACPAPAGPRPMRMRAPAAGAAEPRRNAASIRSQTS